MRGFIKAVAVAVVAVMVSVAGVSAADSVQRPRSVAQKSAKRVAGNNRPKQAVASTTPTASWFVYVSTESGQRDLYLKDGAKIEAALVKAGFKKTSSQPSKIDMGEDEEPIKAVINRYDKGNVHFFITNSTDPSYQKTDVNFYFESESEMTAFINSFKKMGFKKNPYYDGKLNSLLGGMMVWLTYSTNEGKLTMGS